jgi:hypothetical protein
VYNRFFLDIGIHPFKTGEIEEGKGHITAVKEIAGDNRYS